MKYIWFVLGLFTLQISCAAQEPTKGNSAQETVTNSVPARKSVHIKPLGYYSNVRVRAEHQAGYTFRLWRTNDNVVGFVSGSPSMRLVGDPPTAMIEDAMFDDKTGELIFHARALVSVFDDGGKRWVKYSFRGVVKTTVVHGTMTLTDEPCTLYCTHGGIVALKFVKAKMEEMPRLKDTDELKKYFKDTYEPKLIDEH
jgi:hypothetical protein